MRILFRDKTDNSLAVAEVGEVTYAVEERMLQFETICGNVISILDVDSAFAETLIKRCFSDRVDLSAYGADMSWNNEDVSM